MNHEALLYSLDPKVTIKQIKNKEYPEYSIDTYKKLKNRVDTHNIGSLLSFEKYYKFFSIKPQPNIIYYLGNIDLLNQKILGIVGPRKMSFYAKKILEQLFFFGSSYDFITISGMAEGVDQLCHHLSCENTIPTIAVLGGGLGWYLTRSERNIIDKIITHGGLVISEYKLFDKPTHYTFPQRNRLIAGLSDILFLPEAGKKSGSLITVEYAIAMKKLVYATPNELFSPTSEGIHDCIENGLVKPIFNLKNFFAHHFSSKNIFDRSPTIILDSEEQLLLSNFSRDHYVEIEELILKTGKDIQKINHLLTILEMKNLIIQESPGRYVLV